MMQSNAELLRDGYEGFASGDVAAVFAIFAEDVAFHIPGHSPISGDYTGQEEVGGFLQSLGERSKRYVQDRRAGHPRQRR
jgi:ketosteroid isomerase-like protein